MKNEFQILWQFLEQFGPEVEGRAGEEPPQDIKRSLREFARGHLPAAERDRLVAQLKEHPDWVAFLAQEVKSLRSSPSSS